MQTSSSGKYTDQVTSARTFWAILMALAVRVKQAYTISNVLNNPILRSNDGSTYSMPPPSRGRIRGSFFVLVSPEYQVVHRTVLNALLLTYHTYSSGIRSPYLVGHSSLACCCTRLVYTSECVDVFREPDNFAGTST